MAGALLMSTQPLSDPGGARDHTSSLAGGGADMVIVRGNCSGVTSGNTDTGLR
jgi:hypothetical protein